MAISVNTNLASLTAQKSLSRATTKMNTAMERMSTGFRINTSKDDAAGMAVSNKLDYKLSKEEEEKLQKQFPINKQELERLKENKKARIQNKLEMIVLLFWIAMLVGAMYYLYLTLTYQV